MNELEIKIKLDIDVNKRLLRESDIPSYLFKFIELWIKYDMELLEIIKRLS